MEDLCITLAHDFFPRRVGDTEAMRAADCAEEHEAEDEDWEEAHHADDTGDDLSRRLLLDEAA